MGTRNWLLAIVVVGSLAAGVVGQGGIGAEIKSATADRGRNEHLAGWFTDDKCSYGGMSTVHKQCAIKCWQQGQKMLFITDSPQSQVFVVENPERLKQREQLHLTILAQVNKEAGTLNLRGWWDPENKALVIPSEDSVAASTESAPEATQNTATKAGTILKNQDVVKMVKAGLDDTIIVAKIKSSSCQFDTTPDTLIQLKREGISSAVLKTMAEAENSPSPRIPNQSANDIDTLPRSYGYYMFDGTQYVDLIPTKVDVVMGLSVPPGNGYAVDGFAGNAPQSFVTGLPTFLFYQQNVDITGFHLAKLDFVRSGGVLRTDSFVDGAFLFNTNCSPRRTASTAVNSSLPASVLTTFLPSERATISSAFSQPYAGNRSPN